jgi:transcriptional regulator of arginine metabolism
MTNILTKKEITLLNTFKVMLKEKEFRSQDELAYELSVRGFDNISQSKISRMLSKVGAIRTRNSLSQVVYQLPNELIIPKVKYSIDTIALGVKHNGTQIVLKTTSGGASIMARVLDSLEDSFGILGTIAGDDTVLIIPLNTNKIDEISTEVSNFLGLSY